MGILLLVSLSCFFGFIFTAHHKNETAKVQSQLEEERKRRAEDLEQFQCVERVLKNTIRELL